MRCSCCPCHNSGQTRNSSCSFSSRVSCFQQLLPSNQAVGGILHQNKSSAGILVLVKTQVFLGKEVEILNFHQDRNLDTIVEGYTFKAIFSVCALKRKNPEIQAHIFILVRIEYNSQTNTKTKRQCVSQTISDTLKLTPCTSKSNWINCHWLQIQRYLVRNLIQLKKQNTL